MAATIWTEDFAIRSYEVDCRGRLSILSIFNFMQEAASKHADALGVSIQQLLSEKNTWLLSRLKIRMCKYPAWQDRLTVCTWPSGVQRLFALRDFHLIDQNRTTVGAALSAWLVISTLSRRPVRISHVVDRLKPVTGDHVLPDTLDKLPALAGPAAERIYQVRFRDVDINQHVNNVSYVEWILESVSAVVHPGAVLSELEINFMAESFPQNRIIARYEVEDSCARVFRHSLVRKENGQELARARTVWRPMQS